MQSSELSLGEQFQSLNENETTKCSNLKRPPLREGPNSCFEYWLLSIFGIDLTANEDIPGHSKLMQEFKLHETTILVKHLAV